MIPTQDVMIDDETYALLEEYYGHEVKLSTVVQNTDKAGVVRMLDSIIEDWDMGFVDDEMVARAREAKRRL